MNSTSLHTGTTTSTDQPSSLAPHPNDRRAHPPSHLPSAQHQNAPPQNTRHPKTNPRTTPKTAIPDDGSTKLAPMGASRRRIRARNMSPDGSLPPLAAGGRGRPPRRPLEKRWKNSSPQFPVAPVTKL